MYFSFKIKINIAFYGFSILCERLVSWFPWLAWLWATVADIKGRQAVSLSTMCSVVCCVVSGVWFGHFKYKWKRIMNRQEVMEWSEKDWIGLDVEWKPIKEEKRKSLVIYLCFWRQCNASRNWIWNKFNLWLTKFTSFKLNFLLMIYGIKLWTFFWIIEYLWGSGSVCYISLWCIFYLIISGLTSEIQLRFHNFYIHFKLV